MGKREREQKNCPRERGRQTERQRQQIQIYNVIVHQMTYKLFESLHFCREMYKQMYMV